MRPKPRHLFLSKGLALLVTALLASSVQASTFKRLSLETMLERSEIAFVGRVTALKANPQNGVPFTNVSFKVTETLRGEAQDTRTLSFLGGEQENGRSVKVDGLPEFNVGDNVLILAYDSTYYSPIVGFSQGYWKLSPDGFVDLMGRKLSVIPGGSLKLDGEGGEREPILKALRARLGGKE